mmetsp:Transcript_2414/g.6469  ORF Transcript_2414/g.6469 Transcript_2414/m.6469 type:complete len:256 (-) Transcript_2414:29-796(-)
MLVFGVIVNASFAAAPCVGEPWLWGFLLQDLDAETRRMPLVAPLRVNLGERFLELFLVKLEGRRLTVHIESVMLKFEPKDAIERCGQRKDEQLVKRAMVCGKRLAAQRSRRLTPVLLVELDQSDANLRLGLERGRVAQCVLERELHMQHLADTEHGVPSGTLGLLPIVELNHQGFELAAAVLSQVLHRILILGPLDGLVDHLMLAEQVSALQLLRVDLFRQLRVEDLRPARLKAERIRLIAHYHFQACFEFAAVE